MVDNLLISLIGSNDILNLRVSADASDVGNTSLGAPGGTIVWTFANLLPGDYTVYTYAIAPDFPQTYYTKVSVAGANAARRAALSLRQPFTVYGTGKKIFRARFLQRLQRAGHGIVVRHEVSWPIHLKR